MSRDTDNDLEADVRAAIEGPEETPDLTATEAGETQESRARDEHGRFKAVDTQEKPAETVEAKAEEPERTILPPKSWTAAAKAKFNLLDPDVQQEVLRREKEIDEGKAQWDSKAQQYNRFEALFEPVKDRLTLAGIDQFAYTQALIHADNLLRQNPQAGFQQLAQLYGFQMPQGQGTGQPQQAIQTDPALQSLQQQFQQVVQYLVGREQQTEQAGRQEIWNEIDAFSKDPTHIYFENVRPKMVKLLEAEMATSLDEAYRMACDLDPDVKAVLSAKPMAQAKPGKPKGISVTGAPGSTGQVRQANPRASHEDDVRAAIEELAGRI